MNHRNFEPCPDESQPLGWQILAHIVAAWIVWLLIDIQGILEDIERWAG